MSNVLSCKMGFFSLSISNNIAAFDGVAGTMTGD